MEYTVVLITAPSEDEAVKIARAVVGERLAACANIISSVRSIYSWKGELCDEPECMMVVKTVSENFERLEARVRELHPYEVPEIIAVPITEGSKPYLDWLRENTRRG